MRTQAQQTAEQRHSQQLRAEDAGQGFEEAMRDGFFFLQTLEAIRLLNIASHPDDQKRGQQTNDKHHPPGHVLRHEGIDQREHSDRQAPTHGPGTLHSAHYFATVFRIDGFCHQYRAGRPLTTNAKALQCLDDQQLVEASDERGEKGEEREPQNHPLQRAHPAIAIGQRPPYPTADGRGDQGGATD
ncbi:hypothetical protein D3C84_847270 [compost metagenome]